jgi:hypothetical protein
MNSYYLELKGFVDAELVNKLLSVDHIVKDVTFKTKFQYAESNGMGLEPTGVFGFEDTTREVAIPKSTPDLVITAENYGDYLSNVVFKKIFMKKLIELVINEKP